MHCKAGRGRSAAVVMAYLVAKAILDEENAFLKRKGQQQNNTGDSTMTAVPIAALILNEQVRSYVDCFGRCPRHRRNVTVYFV